MTFKTDSFCFHVEIFDECRRCVHESQAVSGERPCHCEETREREGTGQTARSAVFVDPQVFQGTHRELLHSTRELNSFMMLIFNDGVEFCGVEGALSVHFDASCQNSFAVERISAAEAFCGTRFPQTYRESRTPANFRTQRRLGGTLQASSTLSIGARLTLNM